MAKTRECCCALSLRRTGNDLHVSFHKGFKIRLAGIVPVSLEFTGRNSIGRHVWLHLMTRRSQPQICIELPEVAKYSTISIFLNRFI